MSAVNQYVLFSLDEQDYALPLSQVERVTWCVAVTPLPKAPAITLGVISVQGEAIPVVDMRTRFGLPAREFGLYDHMILAKTRRLRIAMPVSNVVGSVERLSNGAEPLDSKIASSPYVAEIVSDGARLTLIHDLEGFLTEAEEEQLFDALETAPIGEMTV